MKRTILFALLLSLLITSCQSYKQITIESYSIEQVEQFSFEKGKMSSKMIINLSVRNPTTSKFTVKQMNAILYTGNQKRFAEITTLDYAFIPAGSFSEVPVLVNVTLLSPLSVLSSGLLSKDSLNTEDMTADIDLIINSGIFSKRIKEKGISVEQLLKQIKQTSVEVNVQ